jgi:hypothetical protein
MTMTRWSSPILLLTLVPGCCLDLVAQANGATGSAGTAGASAGAGSGTGTSTGGATVGTSDGGCGPGQGTAYQPCSADEDCACHEWCVVDPVVRWSPGICEHQCASDADCPNVASVCSAAGIPVDTANVGETCVVNGCHGASPGDSCDSGRGQEGTCIPFSVAPYIIPALLCVPNGTAVACTEGATNDDPFTQTAAAFDDGGFLVEPQVLVASDFCGAGQGCYSPMGVARAPGLCKRLCAWPEDGGGRSCEEPDICVTQDPRALWWGFCLPCGASISDGGPASSCNVPSDCCESNCVGGAGALGLCAPP